MGLSSHSFFPGCLLASQGLHMTPATLALVCSRPISRAHGSLGELFWKEVDASTVYCVLCTMYVHGLDGLEI